MAGGCLKFERGVGATPLSAPVDLWLAVGYSGTSASTKEMVEGVARTRERLPELANKFLEGVRALVENAELAVTSGDAEGLGRLMDLNQMLLAGMMLSTDQIEHMCRSARASGALGAKLTGSGGGGSVIALAGACPRGERTSEPERLADAVVAAWGEEGFTGFATRISGRGAGARDVRAFDGSAQEMDT
jgi:mevalonate kinase